MAIFLPFLYFLLLGIIFVPSRISSFGAQPLEQLIPAFGSRISALLALLFIFYYVLNFCRKFKIFKKICRKFKRFFKKLR